MSRAICFRPHCIDFGLPGRCAGSRLDVGSGTGALGPLGQRKLALVSGSLERFGRALDAVGETIFALDRQSLGEHSDTSGWSLPGRGRLDADRDGGKAAMFQIGNLPNDFVLYYAYFQ